MNVPATFKVTFISVLIITVGCIVGLGLIAAYGSDATSIKNVPIGQHGRYD